MKENQQTANAKITLPAERELRIERVFNASRERVWRANTDPEQLARWWGRGHPLVIEAHELRPGGHWRFIEKTPRGPQGFEGRFSEILAPERLVRTFEWDGMPGHVALETLTFEALEPARTRLVTLSLFMTAADRDGLLHSGMEQGLNESYVALDGVLARGS
jgi:uncharacterized protein YndB with AHSA1/START domain